MKVYVVKVILNDYGEITNFFCLSTHKKVYN